MIKWKHTTSALLKLEELLICKLCNKLLEEPCSLEACDHYFCRNCVEKLVGVESRCPECGAFAWIKDLKPNRQLANIVSLCRCIRSTTGIVPQISTSTGIPCSDEISRPPDCSGTIHYKQRNNEISHQKASPCIGSSKQKINMEKTLGTLNFTIDNDLQETGDQEMTIKNRLQKNSTSFQDSDFDQSSSSIELSNSSCSERNATPYHCERDLCGSKVKQNQGLVKHGTPGYSTCTSNFNSVDSEAQQSKGPKRKISKIEPAFETNQTLLHNSKKSKSGFGVLKQDQIQYTNEPIARESEFCNNVATMGVITSARKKSRTMESHLNHEGLVVPNYRLSPSSIASPGSSVMTLSLAQLAKKNKRGEGLLHIAAIKGNIEDVKYLLQKGANPNARDNAGWSPLHEACNHGYAAIAEMLLDNGAIIDLPGGLDHDTPLHDSVANGRIEVVKLLVKQGAPLTARNKQGMLPIDYAVTETMREALKMPNVVGKTAIIHRETIPVTNLIHPQETSKVILCTGLSTKQKETLEYCTAILGGKVVQEFSIDVTHVVTNTTSSGCCARTLKYMCALLCGKWILSFSWITNCLSAKSWRDEAPHEIQGTSTSKENIPHQSRINTLKQLPGLFDGCQFYFNGLFKTPCKEHLIQLVRYGGGKVLTREPKSTLNYNLLPQSRIPLTDLPVVAYHAKPDSLQYRCTKYAIYDPALCLNKPVSKCRDVSVVPVSWVLDCISNFEIMDVPISDTGRH